MKRLFKMIMPAELTGSVLPSPTMTMSGAACKRVTSSSAKVGRRSYCSLTWAPLFSWGRKKDLTGYTSKADCWSLGVILFLLLSGKHPFSKGEEMIQNIMEGKFRSMTGSMWDTVSSTAKSLVRALLEADPGRRLSADQVLEHPWFAGDQDVCVLARRIMAGGVVDKISGGVKVGGVGVDTVKRMKEVPLIDLTQDSEE